MKLFTLCLACISHVLLSSANAQIIDLGVAVFSEPNFEGRHTFFSEDKGYETSFPIKSIRIPPGWVVTTFTQIDYQGSQKTFYKSCNITDSLIGKVKSIRIDKKNGLNAQYSNRELKRASTEGYVALFGSRGFKSIYARINRDWIFGGWYGIESISVPEGWEIWLFQNKLFEGPHLVLTSNWDGNDPALEKWRDHVKSIRVVRKTALPPLPVASAIISANPLSGNNMVLFEEVGYKGDHIVVNQDWNTDHPIGVESIRVPYGWEVWVYEYNNFEGNYKRLTHSWNGLNGSNDHLWRNNIRSIRIIQKAPVLSAQYTSPHIEVFDESNYLGQPYTLSGNWSCHTPSNQLWDNRISSIRIPQGVRVVVFENPNFSGKSFTLTSSTSLLGFWNNQISSIQVFSIE